MLSLVIGLIVPSALPLAGMLLFGNLIKEIGTSTERLSKAASGPIMNTATIFLGLSVGATMTASEFLQWEIIGIIVGGFLAFGISIGGGIFAVKGYNFFNKKKINPLIGATGLSAVPMASRVANEIALKTRSAKSSVAIRYGQQYIRCNRLGSSCGVLISFLAG